MQITNTTIQFKSQNELMDAMELLRPMLLFRVLNIGKQHQIEFRTLADVRKATETLQSLERAKEKACRIMEEANHANAEKTHAD